MAVTLANAVTPIDCPTENGMAKEADWPETPFRKGESVRDPIGNYPCDVRRNTQWINGERPTASAMACGLALDIGLSSSTAPRRSDKLCGSSRTTWGDFSNETLKRSTENRREGSLAHAPPPQGRGTDATMCDSAEGQCSPAL